MLQVPLLPARVTAPPGVAVQIAGVCDRNVTGCPDAPPDAATANAGSDTTWLSIGGKEMTCGVRFADVGTADTSSKKSPSLSPRLGSVSSNSSTVLVEVAVRS